MQKTRADDSTTNYWVQYSKQISGGAKVKNSTFSVISCKFRVKEQLAIKTTSPAKRITAALHRIGHQTK